MEARNEDGRGGDSSYQIPAALPPLISSRQPLGEVLQRHLHQIRNDNPAASLSAAVMAPCWTAVCKLLCRRPKNKRFDRSGRTRASRRSDKDFKRGAMLGGALHEASMPTNWGKRLVQDGTRNRGKPAKAAVERNLEGEDL